MKYTLALLTLTLVGGCQGRTEIVIGVATDLKAKGQIDTVQLIASRSGTPILMPPPWSLADVPAGHYELPGSFGIYSPDGSDTRVELAVKGFVGSQLVTERDAIVSLVSGLSLFLRLSIVGDCGQLSSPACSDGETCIEGVCRPSAVDANRLPAFRKELVGSVQCDSGTHFVISSTGDPMPTIGSGCSTDEYCQEGTCYKLLKSDDAALQPGVWTQQLTPTTYTLRAMWGTADGADVFAVGDHGTILHLAGAGPAADSGWIIEGANLTTDNLYAVSGTAATDVWAGGANGSLLHRGSDGNWSLVTPLLVSRIDGLSAAGAGSVWLAGRADSTSAVAFHFDGSSWRPVALPATSDLRAVFAASDSDVWLAGHGNLLHGDGSGFTARTLPADSNFSAVAGGGGKVYLVGLGGLVMGGDLTLETSPVSADLFGVWASPSGDEVFAVGDFGTIIHLHDGVWSQEASGTRAPLRGVWGSRSGDLFALGADGIVLHNTGQAQSFDGGAPDNGVDSSVPQCAGPADCAPVCSAAQLTPRSCLAGTCVDASPSPCPDAMGCADAKSCQTSCAADGDCQSGHYCDPGGTCRVPAAQGSYCDDTAGAQCNVAGCAVCAAGLFCTDHVCCDQSPAQCGGCMHCVAPTGTCVPAPFGQDVHAPYCAAMSGGCVMAACNGQGGCGNTGDACGVNACDAVTTSDVDTSTCQNGVCAVDSPLACPGAGCSGASGTCPSSSTLNGTCTVDVGCSNVPGGHCDGHKLCVQAKPKGSPCNVNSTNHCATAPCAECAAGLTCVDGFCCDAACTGVCQACDLSGKLGTCSTVTVGQPHGARAACSGSGACVGFCDGSSAVACTAATGRCALSACSTANNYTLEQAASCAAGACPSPLPASCQPFACVHGACRSRCASDGDCASTTPTCDVASGACQ